MTGAVGGSGEVSFASLSAIPSRLILQRRVGVPHAREVRRARLGVEFREHAEVVRLGLQLRDAAWAAVGVLVVQVAEHDRLRRARLLAGRLKLIELRVDSLLVL